MPAIVVEGEEEARLVRKSVVHARPHDDATARVLPQQICKAVAHPRTGWPRPARFRGIAWAPTRHPSSRFGRRLSCSSPGAGTPALTLELGHQAVAARHCVAGAQVRNNWEQSGNTKHIRCARATGAFVIFLSRSAHAR